MKVLLKNHSEALFFSLYFTVAIFALYRVYSLGPNTYEQGIMYTAAIAAQDGLLPNRDFFQQYGPMTSIFQGLWMQVFGTNLIHLQVFTLFSVLLLAALMFFILRSVLSRVLSSTVALLWLMTGPHGNPWSSIYSNFFAVLGVFLIHLTKSHVRMRSWKSVFLLNLLANSILWMGFFTRIHIIIVILLVDIYIIADRQYSYRRNFLVSQVFSLSLFLFAFLLTGILFPWFQQCFIWAFSNYVGKGPGVTLARIGDDIFIGLIPMTVILTLILIQKLSTAFHSRGQKAYNLFIVIAATFAIAFLLTLTMLQFNTKKPPFTLLNPQVFLITFSQKFFFFFSFGVLSVYIIYLLRIAFKWRTRLGTLSLWDALAVGLLAQLYPLHDPYHIFVVAPGLIISLAISIKRKQWIALRLSRFDPKRTSVQLASVTLLLLLLFQNLILGLRTDYKFNSGILKGINSRSYSAYVSEGQMSRSWALKLEETLAILSKQEVKGDIHFYCKEGLFSAANGEYLPADAFYVDWGPIPAQRDQVAFEFHCGISDLRIAELVGTGLEIVSISTFPSSPTDSTGVQFYVLFRKM